MMPLRMKIFEGSRKEDPNLTTNITKIPTLQSLAAIVPTEIPHQTTPRQYEVLESKPENTTKSGNIQGPLTIQEPLIIQDQKPITIRFLGLVTAGGLKPEQELETFPEPEPTPEKNPVPVPMSEPPKATITLLTPSGVPIVSGLSENNEEDTEYMFHTFIQSEEHILGYKCQNKSRGMSTKSKTVKVSSIQCSKVLEMESGFEKLWESVMGCFTEYLKRNKKLLADENVTTQ